MKTFYVVWNPDTGYTKYQHESHQMALAEAERLAKAHDGQEFIVLQALSRSQVRTVVTEKYDYDDGIPF